MSELLSDSKIVATSQGDILEITFRGAHEWTHGSEMNRYIEMKLLEDSPVAILFNLVDYRYVFGDDVTGLFTAAIDRVRKQFRPVCIAASGTTQRSLYDFFKSTRVLDSFGIEFVSSVESGVSRLRERLEENSV